MRKNTNGYKLTAPAPSAEVKKLLRVRDVADILGVSPVKVYALLKSGLPSVKIDGARRIQPDKLQAWIEQHSA